MINHCLQVIVILRNLTDLKPTSTSIVLLFYLLIFQRLYQEVVEFLILIYNILAILNLLISSDNQIFNFHRLIFIVIVNNLLLVTYILYFIIYVIEQGF